MRFELFYPVKPFIVGQPFADTSLLEYYKKNGVIFAGHNGIDMAAIHGQPVYAAHAGTAYWETDSKQGSGVVLITDEPMEYKNGTAFFKTIYWHLIEDQSAIRSHPAVLNDKGVKGYVIKAGDLLGYADSTGLSTGDHLHFGLKPMYGKDPYEGLNIEQENGYMGAIDPAPYFNGKYASNISGSGFLFTRDMQFGGQSDDIKQLQKKLQELGYFPSAQECTGFYGNITRKAVFAFQQDYIADLSRAARYIYRGLFCYAQTRTALNAV